MVLRLVLAAKAMRHPSFTAWRDDLAARFDDARRRADATHEKEESRFVLGVQGDAARALELAGRNYAVQREPADARALLEAALAARQPAAAEVSVAVAAPISVVAGAADSAAVGAADSAVAAEVAAAGEGPISRSSTTSHCWVTSATASATTGLPMTAVTRPMSA